MPKGRSLTLNYDWFTRIFMDPNSIPSYRSVSKKSTPVIMILDRIHFSTVEPNSRLSPISDASRASTNDIHSRAIRVPYSPPPCMKNDVAVQDRRSVLTDPRMNGSPAGPNVLVKGGKRGENPTAFD